MSRDTASTSSELLRDARFSSNDSSSGHGPNEFAAPTSSQLLAGAAALHPLAGLNNGDLDYLLLDDSKLSGLEGGQTVLPSRGWSDELCYGTGTTYLAGLGAGGLWGLREGLAKSRRIPMASSNPLNAVVQQASAAASSAASASLNTAERAASTVAAATAAKPLPSSTSSSPAAVNANQTAAASSSASAAAPANAKPKTPPFRVRLNAVLNSITRRGTFVGNNAGVLALIYNGFNSSIDKYRGRHDIYGSMLAGASTGLIWKSTAGVRPMFIASAGMTAGAALWTIAKPTLV